MKLKKKALIYLKYFIIAFIVIIAGVIYFLSRQGLLSKKSTDVYDTFNVQEINDDIEGADGLEQENRTGEDLEKTSDIYVYICGQVMNPGVFTCKEGTRLYEIVEMAGGMTDSADAIQLNLADILKDSQRIYVPEVGECGSTGSSTLMNGDSSEQGITKVNINDATIAQLTALPGIGETRASDIVTYRTEHGKFASIDDIKKVSGIKDAAYNKIKDFICV